MSGVPLAPIQRLTQSYNILRWTARSWPKCMTANAIASTRVRNATLGMVAAVIASFGYSALVLVGMIGIRVQLLAGAAYFVLITLWFVLPMGAWLGAYLPRSMAALNRQMAMTKGFRWGAAFGIVCGVLWATQLSLSDFALEMLLWWILLFGGTAGIYSACFVALVGRKYANKELPPNLADSLSALPTTCLPPSLQP